MKRPGGATKSLHPKLRKLQRAVRRIEEDRQSGASQIAQQVARILADATAQGLTGDDLEDLRLRLARSHPTMAAVWNAAHADNPQRFLHALASWRRQAARNARKLLAGADLIVTLSYSSSVVETLLRLPGQVIVGQSLPGGEGERTARALRRSGSRARTVPDASLAGWVAAADAVVLGADAITHRGAVNKCGSRALALVAQAERCPCYVVADSTKFSRPPRPFPPPLLGPGNWFEYVELALLTRVITESGALTPRAVERLVRLR